MTQYEEKLREIAEELARKAHDSLTDMKVKWADREEHDRQASIVIMLPLAALCLEKMAEAYVAGRIKDIPQDAAIQLGMIKPIQNELISLGYKKEE